VQKERELQVSPTKDKPTRDVREKFFIVTFGKQHTVLRLESFESEFFPSFLQKKNIQTFRIPFCQHFPACESNRISDGIEIETSRLFACLPSSTTRSFAMQKTASKSNGRQGECFIELKIIKCCFVVS
jgi:hypothetical protein